MTGADQHDALMCAPLMYTQNYVIHIFDISLILYLVICFMFRFMIIGRGQCTQSDVI